MTVKRITSHDVLAFRGEDGTFCLSEYKNQIGNSRFEVLVDMYREAFELSEGRGQDKECQKIVDRLVEVACHKDVATAVNSGRFLFKITESGPDDWNECNETEAKSLVREVLSNSPWMDEPVDNADLISLGLSSGPSNGMMQQAMLEGSKRGRRRSLLRRSASDSSWLDDRKKALRPEGDLLLDDGQQHVSRSMFGQSPPSTRKIYAVKPPALGKKITEPMANGNGNGNGNAGDSTILIENAMDVILAQNCRELNQRSNIVGNNRLQVMLTLQKGRYRELSPGEQDKVAGNLVKAVCQYWGGRILAEDGNSYNELGRDQAVAAMKALLSPDTVPSPAIAPIPTQSSSLLIFAPIPTQSSPLLINGNKPPPITPDLYKPAPATSLLANAPQPPEFLKQTSMDILKSHLEPDESNMQSAAIRSLQQRNAKRGLAKKLGH
jgi:hypothetical protein